ncbi:MAG: sigma-70 family RNA polymerase sigma factor [Acidimicrobiia bacterium]|nr:sigma-70 family RNA polymerase sigma factor [Acidimicrobiia bacterium]
MGLTIRSADYPALSDSDLVEMAPDDLEAFGELVRRHQDFVFGAAMRIVRNPVMAQDVAQDAFIRAYKALPEFRGDAQFRSWVYRIASNLALNTVQRNREKPTDLIPDAGTPASRGPAHQTEMAELRGAIENAVDELSEELRVPLVLREFGGLSYQEIADETGLPLNTVRTRILRGRRALAEKLEEWR